MVETRSSSVTARLRPRARAAVVTPPVKRKRRAAVGSREEGPRVRQQKRCCYVCMEELDAASPHVGCGAASLFQEEEHVACYECVTHQIARLGLRGQHGLPESPTLKSWDLDPSHWAPFCALCPSVGSRRRLSCMSSEAVGSKFKTACLSHVRERFEKAEAASSKKDVARTLNALLKTGGPVYRCPSDDCGAYTVHTACDDLRAHHLQLQSTDVLVAYSDVFRSKVLDDASLNRLTKLYSQCASANLKKQLPELDSESNLDDNGRPLRGPPVLSNACGSCGFLGKTIGDWNRVCGDCKRAGHPINRQPWGTCCRFCGNYLG